jgi:Bifunctional DNA primase/polymerase, N-terminal
MDRVRYLRRVLAIYRAYHASERSSGGPQDLDQMQVATLCLTHSLALVPSHGIKDSQCTCGDPNCQHPGRHARTANGLDDATDDPELVRGFWVEWPKAKVIIATGQQGIIAVTVCGRKGQSGFDELMGKEGVSTPETIKFRGRRTLSYLFRMSANAIPEGRIRLAPGVVVHGRGSFIVVPRNVTRPGRHKQLFETEITRPPNWLLRRLGYEPIVESTSPEKLPGSEQKPAARPMIAERTFADTLAFELVRVDLAWIIVPDGTPRCDDDKVRALAESYQITDVRRPLALREIAKRTSESEPVLRLLGDPYHLAALKRLGIACAECLVIEGDETDERLFNLTELIHQPEVKVLDRALAVVEWVKLIRIKGGQVAHPRGGKQPHDKGLAAAERVLGVSRRDLARAALIATISPEAQDEVRRAKLDDIQRTLLEIANEPTDKQVEKARELRERYSKPRQKRAANANTKPETGAGKHPVLDDEPTSPKPVEEEDDERERIVESPDVVPVETPAGLDLPGPPRPASDDAQYERLEILWEQFIAPAWEEASETVRVRLLEARGYSVVAANSARKSDQ